MRYSEFLRQRYRAIVGYTGLIGLIIGCLILLPLALLLVYRWETDLAGGFLWPGLTLVIAGGLLWRLVTPRGTVSLSWQEGAVIVVLAWLVAILVGAVPFMVVSGLNFTQAIFEATSGWTTTGLSVIDVTQSAHLVLFYRSVMQLAGGAGLAIITLSALAGPVGAGLSTAEGRSEQLLPHVRRSVNLVLTIYAGYVLVGVLALYLAGMNGFDAVNHAFAALSTGGFSTRAASIGHWDSPVIEAVVVALMLFGTLNFLTAYTLGQRKFKAVARNGELHLAGLLILLGGIVLFLGVTAGLYPTLQKSARVAIFEAVTALSTTGFTTVGYHTWPDLGWFVLVLLMLVGGGTGSTAGGIKQYRIYVLYRGLWWEFRRMFLPSRVVTEPEVWHGEQKQFISDTHLRQVGLFVFLYLVSYFIGSGILTAYGYPLRDSLFEFASTLSTVGLSVGITAAAAPAGVLWAQIMGMFLGRLEFFTIIIGLGKLLADAPVILSKSSS
ncbi:MAG: TrkH family potassium uptake protein [Anaerolineae bacterium]|nr:TrkH family potassium uptake protein [Anaerolineae bacterium]